MKGGARGQVGGRGKQRPNGKKEQDDQKFVDVQKKKFDCQEKLNSTKASLVDLIVSKPHDPKEILRYQNFFRKSYETDNVQFFVAFLIFFNFFVAAINSQMVPEPDSKATAIFAVFEYFFGVVFTIELIYNMYGHWYVDFWKSGWNWFDFIIVIISLLALMLADLPGISVLRLFRAFRVFRLFKRIPSLRLITEGVFASLSGVGNAFLVLFLLMGIWSIMGVEFYGNLPSQDQEFGNFLKAMFTLWQVMSMDSWASQISRNVIYGEGLPLAGFYFVSYLFIAGIIMANVVVAILLEKYLGAVDKIKKEGEDEEEAKKKEQAEKKGEIYGPIHKEDLPKELTRLTDGENDEKKKQNDALLRKLLVQLIDEDEILSDIPEEHLQKILEHEFWEASLYQVAKKKRRASLVTSEPIF